MDDEVLFTFAVPLFVMLPRKTKPAKKIILNFNKYHIWSTFQRNEIKAIFTKQLERTLIDSGLVPLRFIRKIKYELYLGRGGRHDTRNVTNLIDKYVCDALVTYGYLEDDTWQYIGKTEDTCIGIDRNNPRVEVTIYGYPEQGN